MGFGIINPSLNLEEYMLLLSKNRSGTNVNVEDEVLILAVPATFYFYNTKTNLKLIVRKY